MRSMQRVLRYDGLLPAVQDPSGGWQQATPKDLRAAKDFIISNRTETTPFDIVVEGETPGDDRERSAAIVRPWAEVGVTWWLESRWQVPRDAEGLQVVRQRIALGPPRVD